jgi:serine/threonine protein kinase
MGSYRAVKIVRKETFPDERPYEREFEGIRHFEPISRNHPGLVHILHAGRDEALGYFYYSMELADDLENGQEIDPSSYRPRSLAKVIAKRGVVPIDECLRIAKSLTDALKYLHEQGLIHRDIKPANIIFVRDEPKIADIGLVTDIGETKSFVGTQGYVPREGPGTPLADIFSFGKVLYEMSTGFECARFPELPTLFAEGEQVKAMARFNDIVLKACQADHEKRYQSAEAMYEDILELQDGRSASADIPSKKG